MNCIRCGKPENDSEHHPELKTSEWHPFIDVSYLESLEDQLLEIKERYECSFSPDAELGVAAAKGREADRAIPRELALA